MSGTNYVELHAHSAFSFLRAGSSVEVLVARAAALGMRALSLTDTMTLAGVVRFQAACAEHGMRPIVGAELAVTDPHFGDVAAPARLVALAENQTGYAHLVQLLTAANLTMPDAPVIPLRTLADSQDGLIVLTGGIEGALLRQLARGQREAALEMARRYARLFGPDRCFIEAQHHLLPESSLWLHQLAEIARETGLRLVATNGVHHATREDGALYDLLTCTRLGNTVEMPHPERPRNNEASLKSGEELANLFAGYPEALTTSAELADRCDLSLLNGTCVAPRVSVPEGMTPTSQLRALCEVGLGTHYTLPRSAETPQRRQMEHELGVISKLELEEFFLCVHNIMAKARTMGIRCSGRGSAANSIVAYLLGITGVDPLAHGLLFERFLNPERRGMPDIDIDVQSDRREELLRYVERTFTARHAAMVANVSTYRARSALRDVAKALGFPLPLVTQLTKVLHHHSSQESLQTYEVELRVVVAKEAPEGDRERCLEQLPLALDLARRLVGLPRHLSLHNGGMVLTREPLDQLLPVRISANGVRALEVDKDDVERLGLIKFDLLGLRTLGAVEEALHLIAASTGERVNVDALPLDPPDTKTMDLVRSGQTLAVFQIESPGQWHLLAQTQPETFSDLIVQTALFRPGPLQAQMVHPYLAQRQARQRDAVQTPWKGAPADDFWTRHPILGPILADSEGILLFQEQILEVAHQFAGLTYAEADGFRRVMSHAREPAEMAAMRESFVAGALAQGETAADAERVFEAVSHFVGYGFCKSHAAEFARIIYQTAWLKAHYPAHYLAAFLSAQPAGFFPPHVVLEEAKRLGIPALRVDVNRSEDAFSVERVGRAPGRWAIRIGLRQVAKVGEELARSILWERRHTGNEQPFMSLADLCRRLRPAGLALPTAEALVLVGACDGLAPRLTRRQRLWQLHQLWPLLGTTPTRRRRKSSPPPAEQLAIPWEETLPEPPPPPELPALTREQRMALDYQLLGLSAGEHPLRLMRRELRRQGIRPLTDLNTLPQGTMTRVAGWAISAQRPPTAKGMAFMVLEDETGRLPVAIPPRLAEDLYRLVRQARVLTVHGQVERVRWYRALLAREVTRVA